jgi:hypothetical protein
LNDNTNQPPQPLIVSLFIEKMKRVLPEIFAGMDRYIHAQEEVDAWAFAAEEEWESIIATLGELIMLSFREDPTAIDQLKAWVTMNAGGLRPEWVEAVRGKLDDPKSYQKLAEGIATFFVGGLSSSVLRGKRVSSDEGSPPSPSDPQAS